MEQRPISIGIENYKEIIDKEYYYIDKTNFIKELLDKKGSYYQLYNNSYMPEY